MATPDYRPRRAAGCATAPQVRRRTDHTAAQVDRQAGRQLQGRLTQGRRYAFRAAGEGDCEGEGGARTEAVGLKRRVHARVGGRLRERRRRPGIATETGCQRRQRDRCVSHFTASGYFFGQGSLTVVLTVEPSSKLISEMPGQPPRGQLLGVMIPFTWTSLRLPWTFLK